eukprot:2344067-Prymnesium_polylepis.3
MPIDNTDATVVHPAKREIGAEISHGFSGVSSGSSQPFSMIAAESDSAAVEQRRAAARISMNPVCLVKTGVHRAAQNHANAYSVIESRLANTGVVEEEDVSCTVAVAIAPP